MSVPTLYLASSSPRRQELLQQIGIPFQLLPVDEDETVLHGESPEDYARRLARNKALSARQQLGTEGLVLGADTCVVLDGQILGKPSDREDAVATLMALSGREHQVLTAVAVTDGQRCEVKLSRSRVNFAKLDRETCRRYWDTGEPRDKAGSYAVQGLAAIWISRIEGSYSGVMGLPLYETAQLLYDFGVTIIQ
jgi:septum formation protein